MPKYKLKQAVKEDLEDIATYTEGQWGRDKRNDYVRTLVKHFEWLGENPELGKPQHEIKRGYFSYNEGSHVIFYIKHKKYVEIMAILHQRMLPERHL